MIEQLKEKIRFLKSFLLGLLQTQLPIPMSKLYTLAKQCLGEHITLNQSVPDDVGCAEAVSYVLKQAGIPLPAEGIAGTAALYQWLSTNALFKVAQAPTAGAILISPTGSGNGIVEGHTGIVGQYNVQFSGDWGIMSNNSDNGLFQEKWSLTAWEENYTQKGGLPMYYFVYIGV